MNPLKRPSTVQVLAVRGVFLTVGKDTLDSERSELYSSQKETVRSNLIDSALYTMTNGNDETPVIQVVYPQATTSQRKLEVHPMESEFGELDDDWGSGDISPRRTRNRRERMVDFGDVSEVPD